MSDILGHDVNGKPLRSGDPVELIGLMGAASVWNGTRCHVRGPSPLDDGNIEIDIKIRDVWGSFWADLTKWEYVDIKPCRARRIDDYQPGDWSEIKRETGWKPRIEVEA